MKLKIKNLRLTNSQKEAYNIINSPESKYVVLSWSRQSGKSTLLRLLSVQWLMKPKNDIGYITKNYILGKTFYSDLIKIIPKELIKAANASDLLIETILGSRIRFFSAESGDGLRGQTFTHLVCDEFAFFQNLSDFYYEVVSPTIKVKGQKIIFVSTPFGKANLFFEFYMNGLNHKNGWYSLKKTIYEDGLITEEQIQEIKESLPPKSFSQEYLCEFLDSGISFFEGYTELFQDFTYDESCKQYIGIDPSADGKDDFILTKINQKGQVKQYEITGSLDMKYSKCAGIINSTGNLKSVLIEVNGVGKPIYNEIKKLCTKKNLIREWITSNESKIEILSNLAVAIIKKELTFESSNTKLKNQFDTFTMKHTKYGKLQLMGSGSTHDDTILSLAFAHHCKETSSGLARYDLSFT